MPEVFEIIHDPNETTRMALKLIEGTNEEILVLFSTTNAFMRQFNLGSVPYLVKIANSRHLAITVLTPMDESVKTIALDLEKQSAKLRIKSIEPTSRSRITVVIVDRKYSVTAETKDDSKPTITEAAGISTYSTSKSTVFSYVSMFESFLKLTELYEKSQSELRDTTDELEAMKKYLNEVIEEVNKSKIKLRKV